MVESARSRFNIRLQFTNDSSPLVNGSIKVGGKGYTTDRDGFVEIDLTLGQHQVTVRFGENIIKRNVVIDDLNKHQIVDVTPRPTLELVVEELLGHRYKLKSILGKGGTAVVFRAEDRVLNRLVAVKMLSGELEGSKDAQRLFLDEARSLAPLVHPNLVAIHDILSVDSQTFMVLEYITGTNLNDVLKKGPLDEITALRYMLQITRAIVFMHDKGFIHRDIKPGNAVVQKDGTVKLIDFGLAGKLDAFNPHEELSGTPAYMAPEQILGQPLTPKVDIYQIGITLYELLAGEVPFTDDVFKSHVHQNPRSLSDLDTNISLECAGIVARCLSKSENRRPTASQLMTLLQEAYLKGDDIGNDEISEILYNKITKSTVTGSVTRLGIEPSEMYSEKRTPPFIWLSAFALLGIFVLAGIFLLRPADEPGTNEKKSSEPTIQAIGLSQKEARVVKREVEKLPLVDEAEKKTEATHKEPVKIGLKKPKKIVSPVKIAKKKTAPKKVAPKITKKVTKPAKKVGKKVAKKTPVKKVAQEPTKKDGLLIQKDKNDTILLDHKKTTSEDILLK